MGGLRWAHCRHQVSPKISVRKPLPYPRVVTSRGIVICHPSVQEPTQEEIVTLALCRGPLSGTRSDIFLVPVGIDPIRVGIGKARRQGPFESSRTLGSKVPQRSVVGMPVINAGVSR
jgi:hypothetical protein